MKWLLIFLPIAAALEHFAPDRPLLIFLAAAVAIVPLAGLMGHATETIAERTGAGVGGLLTATFGNAAEMVIALSALRAGLHDVVKASIGGAIVANMLVALGGSMLLGGVRHRDQRFNAEGARSQATMLTLAVIALIVPAAYRGASGSASDSRLGELSVVVSIVLLAVYALYLVFSLITHRKLFEGEGGEEGADADSDARAAAPAAEVHPPGNVGRAIAVLVAATLGVVYASELLVGALEPAGAAMGLSDAFVGLFVVAVVGGAAEILSAMRAAANDKMDLSFSIAIGGSVQIALFVAPLLVLLSHVMGPAPMDLAFSGGIVLATLLAVLITGQVSGDGRSHWLKGVQLLAVYVIFALAAYFAPGR